MSPPPKKVKGHVPVSPTKLRSWGQVISARISWSNASCGTKSRPGDTARGSGV